MKTKQIKKGDEVIYDDRLFTVIIPPDSFGELEVEEVLPTGPGERLFVFMEEVKPLIF